MTYRIAINGYGRIGRCFLRALFESDLNEELTVVHINEPANLDSIAYLTRFDSTHGRFSGKVEIQCNHLLIDGARVSVSHATRPRDVDWSALQVDLVVECSGQYFHRSELEAFVQSGATRLLLSNPGNSALDVDATIVYGVNHNALTGYERLVSNASCTTNAVVGVLDMLDRELGIEHVLLTTLHSAMNDQPLADGYHHSDLRRNRSAMQSMIPVSTSLALGVERLLPQLVGRVEAKAIRVPTMSVSAIDLVLELKGTTAKYNATDINNRIANAAHGPWANLIAYVEGPHASIDFCHDPHSAIIDASQTIVYGGRFVNLLIWFDNEWGFSNRLIDVSRHWLRKASEVT